MSRSLSLLASLVILGSAAFAHATTISAGTYTLNNATVAGYTVTGTVTVNSSGSATAANLTFNDAAVDNPGLPSFNQVSITNTFNGLSQNYLASSGSAGQVALFFNTTSDSNGFYDLCLGSVQCGTTSGTVDPSNLQIYAFYNSTTHTNNPGLAITNFSSGYLAPAAAPTVTPEPAPLVLVGSALLGTLGLARATRARLFAA